MKYHFCTITTESHLFKCFALADSIAAYGGFLNVLVTDSINVKDDKTPLNISFNYLSDLTTDLAQKIKIKHQKTKDHLRWSLKPIYLSFLLQEENKVIYVDNDIFFYNNFNFLFEDLEIHPILLTPHHYNFDTEKNQNWLEANFRVGLYNAGFVAANQDALKTLEWWAKACLYRCEKNYWRGLFDDQKYLDLFPIIEPETKIIRHKGCNVAAWNQDTIVRTYQNGRHLINNSFSLIFYHFNNYSLKFLSEEDPIFKEYIAVLEKYKTDLSCLYLKNELSFMDKVKLFVWNILNKMNK